MVRLYTDERMLRHITPGSHPERPERLRGILQRLERLGLNEVCLTGNVRPATDEELLRVHTGDHLVRLAAAEERGGAFLDADTWCGPGSNEAARLAAGSAVEAVRAVLEGTGTTTAFCAIRPPGHHARPSSAMGFCLLGNVAIAAREATDAFELSRVLIVDWDVHHGNGTQEMFYADGRIGFVSMHRYPFYPGTGAANETGSGRGLGLIRNLPVRHGTPRAEILAGFRSAVEALADKVRPELVLISAGFDAHAADPIGDLGLEVEDFVTMTELVREVARGHAAGRLVSMLEGGYNVPVLADCVVAHLESLGVEPAHGAGWSAH